MSSAEVPYTILKISATAPSFLQQRYKEWVPCGAISPENATYAVILGAVELLFVANPDGLAERLQFLGDLADLRKRVRRDTPSSVLRSCARELHQGSQYVARVEGAMMSVKEFGDFDEISNEEVSLFRYLSQSVACKIVVFTSGRKLTYVPRDFPQTPVIRIYRGNGGMEYGYYLLHSYHFDNACYTQDVSDLHLFSRYDSQRLPTQYVATEESQILKELTKHVLKICPLIPELHESGEQSMRTMEVLEQHRRNIQILASYEENELLEAVNDTMERLRRERDSSLSPREHSEGIQNSDFYRDDMFESAPSTRASSYNPSLALPVPPMPSTPPVSNLLLQSAVPHNEESQCTVTCKMCLQPADTLALKPCGSNEFTCLDCVSRKRQLNSTNCPSCSEIVNTDYIYPIDKYCRWYSINAVVEEMQKTPPITYCRYCGEILCATDIKGKRLQRPSCPNCLKT